MKLVELEIIKVRGVHDIKLVPDGKNFLIYGPNGSGKSTIVDAIDFLLTGNITRFTGKGTGDITLKKYGSHIDFMPDDAWVRGLIKIPNSNDEFAVKRCMGKPQEIICASEHIEKFKRIENLAKQGQHLLTRKDILKYITAEPGTRAQEIQELLELNEIENIRKSLVTVTNKFEKGLKTSRKVWKNAENTIIGTIQKNQFNEEELLNIINDNRKVLYGKPISSLHSSELKQDLTPPLTIDYRKKVNLSLIKKDFENILSLTSQENITQLVKLDSRITDLIKKVRAEPNLRKSISLLELTKLGLQLIDMTGNCPLCETPFPPKKLRNVLQQRMNTAKEAQNLVQKIESYSEEFNNVVNKLVSSIEKIMDALKMGGLKNELEVFQHWFNKLNDISISLSNPTDNYPDPGYGDLEINKILVLWKKDIELDEILDKIETIFPVATPEQNAWDTLTRLEENLKALEGAISACDLSEIYYKRSKFMLDSFIASRDNILSNLYDTVRDKFINFYRRLHGPNENNFTAEIKPKGPALDFKVDFYGRGKHPPHALHSEGHQDSMGLCLFLALCDYLTENLLDLMILDDVVMSVDAFHRRKFCNILKSFLPKKQLLLTTHDRTWMNQLKTEKVVQRRNIFQFYNWDIETGPIFQFDKDIWQRIYEDLEKGDVPSAAAKLRRELEEFFLSICDSLRVKIVCNLDGRWSLGDLLPMALSRYSDLLKISKNAANSWKNSGNMDLLIELDNKRKQIYNRAQVEQWAINENVHYSKWPKFTVNDFKPVVDAFKDLVNLFLCEICGGMLYIALKDKREVSVRCNCGNLNWNLLKK